MAKRDLTDGPTWRALAAVSAPMSIGIFAVLSVGLVDAFVLGRLGQAPLAAVGFIYPVTTAMSSMAIGLSAGANAVVSQALGRGASDAEVRRIAFHSVGLGVILAALIALLFYTFSDQLFRTMGANDAVMREITAYVPFWSMGYPCLVAVMVLNAVFRAYGQGALSASIMVAEAVVNIALTPTLVFGWGPVPAMGTEGAALATFAARATSCALVTSVAVWLGYVGWCAAPFKRLATSLREVLGVGLPAAFSNGINPAGMALVTAAVATLGEAFVAGFGAATRVQSLALVVLMALSAGIGPVVGQNWGADKPARARRVLLEAWGICIAYGLIIGAGLFAFADPLARLFTDSAQAQDAASSYLSIVGWSLAGFGTLVVANAAMNARSKAVWSMSLSLGRIFLVYVPAAWVGAMTFGYTGVLIATVAANVLIVPAVLFSSVRTELFDWNGVAGRLGAR